MFAVNDTAVNTYYDASKQEIKIIGVLSAVDVYSIIYSIKFIHPVRRIIIHDCNMSNIHKDTFAGLGILEYLEILGTFVGWMNESIFSDLCGLKTLTMIDCSTKTISAKVFTNLVSLREINIAGRSVTTLETNAFRGLQYLETLRIYHTSLTFIGKNTFKYLVNLSRLVIRDSLVSELHFSTFRNNLYVTHLDLSQNPIATFHRDLIVDMNKLEYLNLSFTNINYIDASAFEYASRVQTINMRASRIEEKYVNEICRYLPNAQVLF